MAAADFNMPFWVAIAAAAPVIGLATAVTADQAVKSNERLVERAAHEHWPMMPGFRWFDLVVAYLNVAVQSLIIFAALTSLSTSHDYFSRKWMIWIETVSLVIVFLPSYISAARTVLIRARLQRAGIGHPDRT